MDQFLPVKKAVRLQMWQERINEFNSSGMHLKDWLEQNNITRDTYYYWLRKCRAAAVENLPADLKSKMPIAEDAVTFKKLEVQTILPDLQPAVIIKLPNATLEVVNGAMQQTVEAVLLALRCTC